MNPHDMDLNFFNWKHQNSWPLCLGIDPHTESSDPTSVFLKSEIEKSNPEIGLFLFSKSLIEAAISFVQTIKFQSALFECHGDRGFLALKKSIDYAHSKNISVILDCKRGDIDSTMQAYGRAMFDFFDADAVTLSPYLGVDVLKGIQSFLRSKFAYVLLVTSNDSASHFQSQFSHLIFKEFEEFICKNRLEDSVGYVFGNLNYEFPFRSNTSLLIPGIGYQQKNALDGKLQLLLKKQPRSLVNVSRGISHMGFLEEIQSWDDFSKTAHQNLCFYSSRLKF